MATKRQRAGERVKMTPDQREAFEILREGAARIGEREARPLHKLGLIERAFPNEQPEGMGRNERLAYTWRLSALGLEQLALPVRTLRNLREPTRFSMSIASMSVSIKSDDPNAVGQLGAALGELVGTLFADRVLFDCGCSKLKVAAGRCDIYAPDGTERPPRRKVEICTGCANGKCTKHTVPA